MSHVVLILRKHLQEVHIYELCNIFGGVANYTQHFTDIAFVSLKNEASKQTNTDVSRHLRVCGMRPIGHHLSEHKNDFVGISHASIAVLSRFFKNCFTFSFGRL